MNNLQPTLTSPLVRLRPLLETDREPLYTLARDSRVWEQHWAHDRWQREAFDAYFGGNLASGGALAVKEVATDRPIGLSRYQMAPGRDDAVEIGWTFLGRDYWGGRYNGTAKKLMIDHAHTFAHYVLLHVRGHNFRSHRAVEKIGGRAIAKGSSLDGLRKRVEGYTSYVIERP